MGLIEAPDDMNPAEVEEELAKVDHYSDSRQMVVIPLSSMSAPTFRTIATQKRIMGEALILNLE